MKGSAGTRKPLALGLGLLVVATFAIASTAEAVSARREADTWLDNQAQLVTEVVGEALNGVLSNLEAVAGFIEEAAPDAGQFERFVDHIDGTANAVGIGYMIELEATDFDAYVEEQRAALGADYQIFAIDDVAEEVPIEREGRSTFYPVRFFSLGETIRTAMAADPEIESVGPGLDAGFDPIWRADIARALDLDGPTYSGFTSLTMDFVVLDRVFFASVPVKPTAGATRGLVVAMMVEQLLLPELDREILSEVDWEAIPPGGEAMNVTGARTRTYPLELPGTSWTLAVAPTDEALSELRGLPWWITGLIAAAIAFFAALALWLFIDRRSESNRAARLRQIAEDKDRFLASVSHELRTPLTVVSGLAYELHDRPTSFSSDERDDLMGMLVEQTDELTGIVEDLLVAARSDIARVTIHHQEVDLGEIAIQTMEGLGIEGQVRGQPGHADADPQRVRQIVRNLLTNAKRYGGEKVRIDFAEGGTWTEVVVADNGDGVPVGKRKAIFESYESAHDPSTEVQSVGLGLYISRTLARAMGGDLEYVYDGEWSHFRLKLRSAQNHRRQQATPASKTTQSHGEPANVP